jgi:hypothetical protein
VGKLANKDLIKIKKDLIEKSKGSEKVKVTESQIKSIKTINEETFLYVQLFQE